MKHVRIGFAQACYSVALLCLLAVLAAACNTGNPRPNGLLDVPPDVDTLHIGDRITIEFSGLDEGALPKPTACQINDHGAITLPQIGEVIGDNLKPRELEALIVSKYVPGYYKTLVVTVNPQERIIVVGGDVKMPNSYRYSSGLTVTKAIQTAGGFTEFGNRRNVRLRRAHTSKDIIVNVLKALENPEYDFPVYPGDLIFVKRKIL